MPIEILMPALSPTMEEGTIAKWFVKEGDVVSPGDIMAEIETDKAIMEFEASDEGTIGKIFVPAGDLTIKVNEKIAVLLTPGESLEEASTKTEQYLKEKKTTSQKENLSDEYETKKQKTFSEIITYSVRKFQKSVSQF